MLSHDMESHVLEYYGKGWVIKWKLLYHVTYTEWFKIRQMLYIYTHIVYSQIKSLKTKNVCYLWVYESILQLMYFLLIIKIGMAFEKAWLARLAMRLEAIPCSWDSITPGPKKCHSLAVWQFQFSWVQFYSFQFSSTQLTTISGTSIYLDDKCKYE